MVYINTVEQVALIAKIINVTLFILLAFAILRQKKDYIINKMYFVAFLCWALYIGMDAILFIFIPVSQTWYFIGNRLRDIGIVGVLSFAFLVYKSFEIIKDGEDSLNKRRLYIEIGLFVVIAGLLVWVDRVDVFLFSDQSVLIDPADLPPPDTDFVVKPVVPWYTMILSAIPLILFVYTVTRLFILVKGVERKKLRNKMLLLTIGITLIPIGMVYFIIMSPIVYAWWSTAIGYTVWTIAPVLIWLSQIGKENS
jgi:hypothetical protein